ncbi:MAG: hypothetical protein R2838_24600 [Caldilineaceae bacterium]
MDADGLRDIVLTTNIRRSTTGATRATAPPVFLPNVAHPAYVLGWYDLDGDGDLDLVTAPYDAAFSPTRQRVSYERQRRLRLRKPGDRLAPTRLTGEAQAFAWPSRMNDDQRPDIPGRQRLRRARLRLRPDGRRLGQGRPLCRHHPQHHEL